MEDSQDCMHVEGSKWSIIAEKLNANEVCQCYRNVATCKYKWQTMPSEYKKIVDYHKGIGINFLQYFCLDRENKREKNLPCLFFEWVYQ